MTPNEAIKNLEAVICDPEGQASIHGSKGDLEVIDAALPAIRKACTLHDELVAKISAVQQILNSLTISTMTTALGRDRSNGLRAEANAIIDGVLAKANAS